MSDSFYDRVADECGRSSKGLMQIADALREHGDAAMAGLAEILSQRLSKLAYDAMTETQTITLPPKKNG